MEREVELASHLKIKSVSAARGVKLDVYDRMIGSLLVAARHPSAAERLTAHPDIHLQV